MLLSFTDEQVGRVNEYGLAVKQSFDNLINILNIQDMRDVMAEINIPLPERKGRRAPHVDLITAHGSTNPQVLIAMRRKLRTQFLLPPEPLSWEAFHALRAQVIMMGKLLYEHLSGGTSQMRIVSDMLSN